MKEICIINYRSPAAVYGIGTYINEYVYCLVNIGCKINIVELGTNDEIHDFCIKEEDNVRKIFIPYLSHRSFVKYNKGVCRLLRHYINDSNNLIFHFHYRQSESLLECIQKCFPLSKSVYTIHYLTWSDALLGNVTLFKKIIQNIENQEYNVTYSNVIENYKREKLFLEKFNRIVCLSEDTYNLVNNEYGVKRNVCLIPNGLRNIEHISPSNQKDELRKKYYITSQEKIFLFVGRINPIKGIKHLIRCFNEIIKDYPHSRLVIIGSGDVSIVLNECKYSWSKVTFIGRTDKKTLYEFYSIADIAIFPSFYEECSYVGIEMLMHGLPIVSSDGYSVKNMFLEGINSKIAKIDNWEENETFEKNLKEAIITLLNDEIYTTNIKMNAKKTYYSKYSLENMEKMYFNLLSSLV